MNKALPLFVYGTLLDVDILSAVLGRALLPNALQPANLPGYSTLTYPGESFPVLCECSYSSAAGALLHGLSEEDWQRIDFYEGDEYGFVEIKTQTAAGEVLALINHQADSQLDARTPWTIQGWVSEAKPAFLPLCQRYMALFGSMSIAEADVYWQQWQAQ
ncbi:MAG: gamma-glutamylcyclotransferase family protein [Pseudomonadales bacterium]